VTSLFLGVLALVVIAAALVVGIQYVPVGSKFRVETITKVEQDVSALRRGFELYLEDSRDPLTGAINLQPTNKLMLTLSPAYVFQPRGPQSGIWSAGIAERDGRNMGYFCLAPPEDGGRWSASVKQGILDAAGTRFPVGSAFVAGTCGATATTGGDVLTYWFPPIHARTDTSGVAFVSAPTPNVAMTLDMDRPVRVRFGVEALMESDFGSTMAQGTAFLEIREPGGSWIIADEWSPSVAVRYDRVISATFQGQPVDVQTTVTEANVQSVIVGSVTGSVPAGWQVRVRFQTSGSTTLLAKEGQLHRM